MGGTVASLIYLGILVVAVGAYLFRNVRLGLGQTLQMALVWGMIFLGAMAVFRPVGGHHPRLWPSDRVGDR